MFKLNESFEVDRKILKCVYIRYSNVETSTINTPNSQRFINIPKEDSVIFLLNFHLELKFEVIKRTDTSRYANEDDIRLRNLGPITLFSILKLTTNSGKHLEDNNHAHNVSLLYKIISSAKYSDDLPIGFDPDRNRRQNELSINKNMKGKFHVSIMLKDVFGFAEHQEKATYGFG